MTDDERAALVDELEADGVISFDYDSYSISDMDKLIDRLLAAHDLDAIRLQAQVKYLRDYLISVEVVPNQGGKPLTREQIGRIIGAIDGNMAVAADRAVAQAQGRGEGA